MIEITDRRPLNNGKNNVLKLTIPDSVTTIASLISLLKAGVYGDVFANNATDEDNKGAAIIGTPVNKRLWDSIREANLSLVDIPDIRYEQFTTSTTGWVSHSFDMPFNAAPACLVYERTNGVLKVGNVTQYGYQFYSVTKNVTITALYIDTGENLEVL